MTAITAPGIYDLPAEVYHADPVPGGSLSSSGARRLLPPHCPARYRHEQDHPRTPTAEMNLGSAAHRIVLGAGADLVEIDAGNYRTKAAQEQRDEALADGRIPVLPHEHEQVQAMAKALREHETAATLLGGRAGAAEQALFWVDEPSGIWRRALLDWLPEPGPGRMILADYKTCDRADYDSAQRAIARFGYHQQAAWYEDAVKSLGLADDAASLLVFQETAAPYLVHVVQPDPIAMRIGRTLNRQAIDTYRACVESGRWPGYGDGVSLIRLPVWTENRHLEMTS